MQKYRYSRQRERILEMLRDTDVHPTADWIYDRLKKEFSGLSLGTVYRNLNILHKMGLIDRMDFGSTFDRYDAKIKQHYHFICENCGSVIDLETSIDDKLNDRVEKSSNFKVNYHRIQFFGLCDKCRSKV
jgi:Fe2+ or Zn2+ uptake regulation protein